MIYDFFAQFGIPGQLLSIAMIFPPIIFCWWLKKKWKVLTLRPPRRYFFFGTMAGVVLAVIILAGHMMQGTLFNPVGPDGKFTSNALSSAREHSRIEYKQTEFLNKWKEGYDKANSGIFKPRDAFFLPWLFGFSGLAVAYVLPWTRSTVKKRKQALAKQKEAEARQKSIEQKRKKKKAETEYDDLESAITFFAEKAKRIDSLDIDEDEKEMLLMKLQEKKERAMEQYV